MKKELLKCTRYFKNYSNDNILCEDEYRAMLKNEYEHLLYDDLLKTIFLYYQNSNKNFNFDNVIDYIIENDLDNDYEIINK